MNLLNVKQFNQQRMEPVPGWLMHVTFNKKKKMEHSGCSLIHLKVTRGNLLV